MGIYCCACAKNLSMIAGGSEWSWATTIDHIMYSVWASIGAFGQRTRSTVEKTRQLHWSSSSTQITGLEQWRCKFAPRQSPSLPDPFVWGSISWAIHRRITDARICFRDYAKFQYTIIRTITVILEIGLTTPHMITIFWPHRHVLSAKKLLSNPH